MFKLTYKNDLHPVSCAYDNFSVKTVLLLKQLKSKSPNRDFKFNTFWLCLPYYNYTEGHMVFPLIMALSSG